MADNQKYHWSTISERKFLEGLGTWGDRPKDKQELLEKYYRAALRRETWKKSHEPGVVVSIDRNQIIREVAQELLR